MFHKFSASNKNRKRSKIQNETQNIKNDYFFSKTLSNLPTYYIFFITHHLIVENYAICLYGNIFGSLVHYSHNFFTNPAIDQNISCLGLCLWIFARKAMFNVNIDIKKY